MKTILYSTISANGFIARTDGKEDFLSDESWHSFAVIAKVCGCIIIGRKTYEVVQDWDEDYNFDTIEGIDRVVMTHDLEFRVKDGYMLASSPTDALTKLAGYGHQKMLVVGGSGTYSAFIKEGIVDEIILNVEPYILGTGIPVFASSDFDCTLELLSCKTIKNGIFQLHYKVIK